MDAETERVIAGCHENGLDLFDAALTADIPVLDVLLVYREHGWFRSSGRNRATFQRMCGHGRSGPGPLPPDASSDRTYTGSVTSHSAPRVRLKMRPRPHWAIQTPEEPAIIDGFCSEHGFHGPCGQNRVGYVHRSTDR